jgi:hypothetical protein
MYNKKNIIKSVRYDVLSEMTLKKKNTIKIFFSRHKLDVSKRQDFISYLNKV